MAGYRPARGGVLETMADFYKRREREVATFGREAEAAAHKAYGEAIRSGRDLVLRTQDEVSRFGASLMGIGRWELRVGRVLTRSSHIVRSPLGQRLSDYRRRVPRLGRVFVAQRTPWIATPW